LTVEEKNRIHPTIFKGLARQAKRRDELIQVEEVSQKHWGRLDSIAFESFKNFDSIKLRKEIDMIKKIIQTENSRNYILLRWIEHHIKNLKQVDRKSILSEENKLVLNKIYQNLPIFGLDTDVVSYITHLQQKIKLLEEKYHNQGQLKKINFSYWSQVKKIVYLHLYSPLRTADISKANIVCRLLSEKEEKPEKGWLIDTVELKNCKFDQGKGCL
jgi:hypothetical protein